MNRIDQLAEHVHFLRKFRVFPEIIFVVVLDDERNAAFAGVGQTGFDALCGQFYALIDREFGSALTGKDAAIGSAQGVGHIDPAFLFCNFVGAESRIGVRKIRGAAHHRNHFAVRFDLLAKPRPVGFVGHFQKSGVPLQAIDVELDGEFNPFRNRHRAVFAEGLDKSFGKNS